MNKRGEEKFFSVWWFFSIILVLGVISFSVFTYYSSPINVKQYQADLISRLVVNCLANNAVLVSELDQEDFDFFKFCNLDKSAFNDNYALKISFLNSEGKDVKSDISVGRLSLLTDCEISNSKESKNFPGCSSIYSPVSYYESGERKVLYFRVLVASQGEGNRIPFKIGV